MRIGFDFLCLERSKRCRRKDDPDEARKIGPMVPPKQDMDVLDDPILPLLRGCLPFGEIVSEDDNLEIGRVHVQRIAFRAADDDLVGGDAAIMPVTPFHIQIGSNDVWQMACYALRDLFEPSPFLVLQQYEWHGRHLLSKFEFGYRFNVL